MKPSPLPTGERIRVADAPQGGFRSSPVVGITKADSAPDGCRTCDKTAKTLEKLQREDWECSHVSCPHRRQCWSAGTGPRPYTPPLPERKGPDELFDRVDA